MKKFFQRLDNSSSRQQGDYSREPLGGGGAPSSHTHGGSFIGKVFSLGQYHCTVEDIIAEGGFALVFLVKAQSNLGRFALKRLHVNNEQDLNNCKREIEIAKQLGSHKNIVQLVESSINLTSNGVYEILMLMQYCKGHLLQLLNDRLKDGLPEGDVVKILCDICEAIARMHHNDPPIIHRDLKVENILISESGTYLLCDFGSATTKVLSIDAGHSALSIEEEIKRYTTLSYRSPEMVDVYSGKPITTKADIWALGCLLYKLCFFTLPFGESTLAIQNAALTIPDGGNERYSAKLLSLIGYMLTANPEERPDIYQVSALSFALIDQKSPVPNRTVTKTVKVPDWAELRVPPTESQARETREARKISSVSANSVQMVVGPGGILEQLDNRTTSVTPRQRPKASININSVLATSPLPYNRATTPSDLSATSNPTPSAPPAPNNTLSVTPSGAPAPSHLTSSASFNSNLRTVAVDDDDDDVDWSKKKAKAKKRSPPRAVAVHLTGQSTSNPQLNATYDYPAASKNPFLDADGNPTGIAATIPEPPSRRHSQTPPGVGAPLRELPSAPNAHHHAHRRNMSDTSAFSSKNVAAAAATAAAAAAASAQALAPPQSAPAVRVRSLNPFEDPNDVSYEDQLFGHEFDKIRQEIQGEVRKVQLKSSPTDTAPSLLDPFEAAPFNSAQLKRYFERQQSSESDQSITPGKPYLLHVISTDPDHQVPVPSLPQPTPKSSTVIMIRSNNDFVITSNNNQSLGSEHQPRPSSISASSSSAFVALAPPPPAAPTSGLEQPTTAQSISSSSQGQITFGPAANYMPLYSSDTAEDSEDSSDDSSDDSDDDSVKASDNPNDAGEDEEEMIDGEHVAQEMSCDLMKPLVVDEEDEDEDGEEDDDDDDFGSESSIGSASDLNQTDSDSDSDTSSDGGAHYDDHLPDHHSTDSEDPVKSLKSPEDSPQRENGHESDHGFEFVNYDGTACKNGSTGWYKYKASTPGGIGPSKGVSRIQITSSSMEIDQNLEKVIPDGDETSVGEVLSTTSSINSLATRNTVNDNTSASIDLLIGHIEGHRPLLEEEDDQEDSEDPVQTVKPFIEMDKEIEFIPQSSSNSAAPEVDSIMFNSMSSSISSVILKEQPKDLLTEDPSPVTTGLNFTMDFESLSLQQIVDETEENRKLDEEVAQSLNSQVIHDQLTNKDLFGSIPFNDKELINKTMMAQKSVPKPEVAPKPVGVLVSVPPAALAAPITVPAPLQPHVDQKFESFFTEVPKLPEPPQISKQQPLPPPPPPPSMFIAPPPLSATLPGPPMKSTDLFGAIPFQGTGAVPVVPVPVPSQLAPIKLGPPPPLQIISLKPVNHGPPVAPKPVFIPGQLTPKSLPQPTISMVSSSSILPSTSAQLSKPILVKSVSAQPVPPVPVVPLSPEPLVKNVLVQKSNSKLKSKVAKKYEVDESDDEVDGLLDPNDPDEAENILEVKGGKESKKKDKKKDKKEKPDKKSKEKDKSKESKKKEKIKEPKPEKEKKEKVKEPKKSKEEKEKEKQEKKKKTEKEKESKESKKAKSKSLEDSTSIKLILNAACSTPLKASKEGKEPSTKESSKSAKLKVPKHQAFANMSFEDETHSHAHHSTASNHVSASSNAVTITRC